MTDEEFAAKVDSEGGIWAALEYGLRSSDLDDSSSPIAQAWAVLEKSYDSFGPIIEFLEGALDAALEAFQDGEDE